MSLIVSRRSSHLTERVAQAETLHQNAEREYALNLTKALKKKAEQCTYETKICEILKGGNRVFQMSAGIYELYKMSLMSHFETVMQNDDCPHVIQIKTVKDRQGKVVESQIRVNQRKASGGPGSPKYTINLYHTRSSMMVNGREAELFTEAHKVAISHIINIKNLDSIDEELHSILVCELEKIQVGPISSTSLCKGVKEKSQSLELPPPDGAVVHQPEISNDNPNMSQQFLCLHCDQSAQMNVIECSSCTNWFHFACEGLSEDEFQSYDDETDRDYICIGCRSQNEDVIAKQIGVIEDSQADSLALIAGNSQAADDQGAATPNSKNESVLSQEVVATGQRALSVPNKKLSNAIIRPIAKAGNSRKTQPNNCQTSSNSEVNADSSGCSVPSSVSTNQPIADNAHHDGQDLLAEQLLKSKEKLLNNREKKLKDLEKKLHLKEISLSDQIQQNDFSKAYIVTMENKVKELESSNRLMKMKLLSQMDAGIDPPSSGLSHGDLPSHSSSQHTQEAQTSLKDRVLSLEMKLLEQRITQLEQLNSNNQHTTCAQHFWPYGAGYLPQGYMDTGQNLQHAYYYNGGPWTGTPNPNGYNYDGSSYRPYLPEDRTAMWMCQSSSGTPPISDTGYYKQDAGANRTDIYASVGFPPQPHPVDPDPVTVNQEEAVGERIPVHFSCRGRRKTTRLKDKLSEQTPIATPGPCKNGQTVEKLDIPSKTRHYPPMLLMNHSSSRKRSQRCQETPKHQIVKKLQIPRIVELDIETDPPGQMPPRYH